MMKRLFTAATLLALASSVFAAPPDVSKLPPPSTQAGVTYAKDIQPIFQENCIRCHGAQAQKGDVRLDSLAAVTVGTGDGRIVIPGDSAHSQLVISAARIGDSPMPPMHKRGPGGAGGAVKALSADQVGLIRAWIDQGAK